MSIQESRARLAEAVEAYKSAHPGRDLTVAREELTNAREYYYADCVWLAERLPAILAPFAAECNSWHPRTSSDETVVFVRDITDYVPPEDHLVTIGDLRALGALYEEVKDAKG